MRADYAGHHGQMLLAVLLGIAGAACLGAGFVVQQAEAAVAGAGQRALSVRLLWRLMRRRGWWAGVGLMVVGYALAGWSLGEGNLVLVEPILAANLLFAVTIAAARCRRRPSYRSLVGGLALVGGMAGFVLVGQPHGGLAANSTALTWVWAGIGVAAALAVLAALAVRYAGPTRAVLLGTATGIVYGLQDALSRQVFADFDRSPLRLLAIWPVLSLVAVGALGVVLAQNAFDAAPLTASLPAISVLEPLTGIGLGIALFDVQLAHRPVATAGEAGFLAILILGAVMVARDRVVHDGTRHRPVLARVAAPYDGSAIAGPRSSGDRASVS